MLQHLLKIIIFFSLVVIPGLSRATKPDFEEFFQYGAVMLLIEPDSGRIVDANPAAANFYGYSQTALRAMSIQACEISWRPRHRPLLRNR